MLEDIFEEPQKVVVDNKEYTFEYNHAALAMLEKKTGKSPYEIYEKLMGENAIMLTDSLAIVVCGALKHHSKEEILELENKLREHPGLWYQIKEPVIASFIFPMLPPKVLSEILPQKKSTKKQRKKRPVPNTNG